MQADIFDHKVHWQIGENKGRNDLWEAPENCIKMMNRTIACNY